MLNVVGLLSRLRTHVMFSQCRMARLILMFLQQHIQTLALQHIASLINLGSHETHHSFMQLRGKERSKQQFEDLFEASGFRLASCHPTRGPMWFIEADPV